MLKVLLYFFAVWHGSDLTREFPHLVSTFGSRARLVDGVIMTLEAKEDLQITHNLAQQGQ